MNSLKVTVLTLCDLTGWLCTWNVLYVVLCTLVMCLIDRRVLCVQRGIGMIGTTSNVLYVVLYAGDLPN